MELDAPDLGITISSDLKSSNQCIQACSKANKMLGMIKKTSSYKKPEIMVAYIDIKSAFDSVFDSVDRTALWKALRSNGVPLFLLQLIEDLH